MGKSVRIQRVIGEFSLAERKHCGSYQKPSDLDLQCFLKKVDFGSAGKDSVDRSHRKSKTQFHDFP